MIKEQLKQKQEVLEAEMEAFRREKEARAEEVTFDLLSSKKITLCISVRLPEDKVG